MAGDGTLELIQVVDDDGGVRLRLKGEFDHSGSPRLLERLNELREGPGPVRLDLSELEFIDSGGVRAVLRSVRDAESEGRRVEVDRHVSWQVKQVFDVLGLDAMLWPENGPER